MTKTPRTAQALDAYIEATEASELYLSQLTGVNRALINQARRGKLNATPALLGPIIYEADGFHAKKIVRAYANDMLSQVAGKLSGKLKAEITIELKFPPENH